MSSNKTKNFGLHAWEPTDSFLRAEINENFELLDGAVIFGSYTGNGAIQHIETGFSPRAVYVLPREGFPGASGSIRTGLFGRDMPMDNSMGRTDETGFTLNNAYNYGDINKMGMVYYYLALR